MINIYNVIIIIIYKTILHYACKSKNSDLVRYLLTLEPIKITEKDIFYFYFLIQNQFWIEIYKTILHIECKIGDLPIVKELIESNKFEEQDIKQTCIIFFFVDEIWILKPFIKF